MELVVEHDALIAAIELETTLGHVGRWISPVGLGRDGAAVAKGLKRFDDRGSVLGADPFIVVGPYFHSTECALGAPDALAVAIAHFAERCTQSTLQRPAARCTQSTLHCTRVRRVPPDQSRRAEWLG